MYNALRKNKIFRKYKIGFAGSSEAGASALISAAKVKQPDFLIQLVTNVNPQDKKDLQIFTYINLAWMFRFISDKGFGMQFNDVSYMFRFISDKGFGMQFNDVSYMFQMMLDDMKHYRIGDIDEYAQQLYHQYEGKMKNNKEKEMFTWLITAFLKKQINEDIISPRLWWNAKPYYKFVKCPILFLAAIHDNRVLFASNVVEFEKTMFENQNKNFTSLVVDATHHLLDINHDPDFRHPKSNEIDNTKRYEIYDSITRWLVKTKL